MAILRNEDGTPVTWDSPNEATIKRRFGANTKLVKAGDGRWVLQVPEGTPPVGVPVSPQSPVSPSFLAPGPADFGSAVATDPVAQSEIADLLAEFKTRTGGQLDPTTGAFVPGETQGTLGSDYQKTLHQLAAQRPLIEQSYQNTLRNTLGEMSGRGLLRSGLKEQEDARARAERLRATQDIEHQGQQAGTDLSTSLSQAADRLIRGRAGITTQAGANWQKDRITNFSDTYGGDTSTPTVTTRQGALAPQPVPQRSPVKAPTYREFVATHGGTSTATLAAKWRKRFGPKKVAA